MSSIALITIYGLMLVFDAFILAGTAFLVSERGWSAWWFVLAVVMCAGSYPGKIMQIAMGCKT